MEDPLSIRQLFTFSKRIFPTGYFFPGESHDFYEVVAVLSGQAGTTAGRDVYLLRAGQLIIHAPGEFHKIWAEGTEAEVLIFSFRAPGFAFSGDRVFAPGAAHIAELTALYEEATRVLILEDVHVRGVREGCRLSAAALCKRLELFLLSVLENSVSVTPRLESRSADNFARVLAVMEAHIDEALTVPELSKLCGMSVPSLEKTLARYTGQGVMAYYRGLRMQRATELLRRGLSVKETAMTLGFANQNVFSASYKKWSDGTAPSDVRVFRGGEDA